MVVEKLDHAKKSGPLLTDKNSGGGGGEEKGRMKGCWGGGGGGELCRKGRGGNRGNEFLANLKRCGTRWNF